MKKLHFKKYYLLPNMIFLISWLVYINYTDKWYIFIQNWFMSITMIFGSFVAGATPEGGGAIAFPIMTLVFNIQTDIARNFSLAIQSVGMTAASFLILYRKIKIDKTYLYLCSIGGFFGIFFGTYLITPFISPAYTKMFFVSLWLSFGVILFVINLNKSQTIIQSLPTLSTSEKKQFIFLGFLGGIIVSIVGSGIDILTFSVVTLRYRLSEKVATPTSVLLMTGNTLTGFLIHAKFIGDFGIQEFNYWLVCIPVVIFGAPLGAYFINKKTRNFIAYLLYVVLVIQFLGALVVLKPTGSLAWFTFGTFCAGLILFFSLSRNRFKAKKYSK